MLYFAPINLYGNYIFRHILLDNGADYAFSELIMINKLDHAKKDNKLDIIKEDIPKTIFQIGVSSIEEIDFGAKYIIDNIKGVKEININMGCPQSTMQMTETCGGLLFNTKLMGQLAHALSKYNIIPSAKIRLGVNRNDIRVHEYLNELQKNGIKKVYIHARTLRYGYTKPALKEEFNGLQEKFPKLTLIYNGDIDSPDSSKISNHVMIGRAALSNPFIFRDIKENKMYSPGEYSPILKDPYLEGVMEKSLKNEKIKIINEYLDLAIKHSLRSNLVESNLDYLLKGVSKSKEIIRKIREQKEIKQIKDEFNQWAN